MNITTTMSAANADPITTLTNSGAQPAQGPTRIEIFTDGSCIGNPGHGGWGAIILRKDTSSAIIKVIERSGWEAMTTNNRMEMTAACAALESLGSVTNEPIFLFCDATIIPNAMNEWLKKWKAGGWKKANKKPVENRDLWGRMERAAEGRDVTWAWVRGHNGDQYNERADKLAYRAAREAERALK